MPRPGKDYTFCMDRITPHGRQYICTVCVGKDGKPLAPLHGSHMVEHANTILHQTRVQAANTRAQDYLGTLDEPPPCENPIPQVIDKSRDNTPSLECHSRAVSPTLLGVEDGMVTPPIPPYDFFQDSAYGGIGPGEHDLASRFAAQFRSEFPAPDERTPLPLWSKTSAARSNPYNDKTWDPYGNKPVFLTHSLFNAPAIQFSQAQQMAILDWAFEMGARDVPSMYQLDKCSQKIKHLMGDSPTRMFKTQTGHVFYVNQVNSFLRQDFANRSVREQMEFYPHDCDGFMSEVWHGEKMALGHNRDQLTPMVSHGGCSFFVNELTLLDDGSLFLTDMFLKHHGELSARGRKFEAPDLTTHGRNYFRFNNEIIDCPVSRFRRSCVDLTSLYPDGIMVSDGNQEWCDQFVPHPLREKANGREVYSVPFIVFLDDVSGNTSKQWNKHWSCYVSNASLPREKLNERLNIRFMSTSQYASPIEIMEAVRTDFDEAFDDPIVVWDATSGREVLVRPYIHFLSGDNPMQAEECSTLGLKSNLFCRTCGAGGTHAFKASAEGFPLQMQAGELRSPAKTIACITRQYDIAFTSKSAQQLSDHQRDSGVKDSIAQPLLGALIKRRKELQKTTSLSLWKITEKLRAEYSQHIGGSDLRMNPLLSLRGFNVHLDTPTETLHTILLGVVKYLWLESINQMDKQHVFPLFCTRLRSVSVSGLDCGPVSNYITTNRGSLNGKHYRTLIQLAPFCLHNLVETELVNAWLVLGRLTVLVWYSSIDNIDEYVASVGAVVNDFLYTLAKCAPALIVQKAKAHLLVHMPMYARRFGPLLGPSSERYESFNATFRATSVHSNRQAPSRDIANSFAVHDSVKHILTGGFWLDTEEKQYRGAGTGVINYCTSSTFIERLLGGKQSNNTTMYSGSFSPWESYVPTQVSRPDTILPTCTFRRVKNFHAKNGDAITAQCNVIYCSAGPNVSLGFVYDILLSKDQGSVIIILQVYHWVELDPVIRMPVVALNNAFSVVQTADIICKVNLQHRCSKAGCMDDGVEVIQEERQDSAATRPTIKHKDHTHYLVNISALHNSKTIRQLVCVHFDCFQPFQVITNYSNICKEAVALLHATESSGVNKQGTGEHK
ncbi:hypothetical protein RSAG8_03599, partial [Rhizoctonia solani AG-8 WAC10335]